MTKKSILILLIAIASVTIVHAQKANSNKPKKPCPAFVLNLDNGTLNSLKPTASQQQIKAKLPCFTGVTENGSGTNCGGGVFYLNDAIFFYTGLKVLNIRDGFKGKIKSGGKTVQLLGASKTTLNTYLGEAFSMTLEDEEANNFTLNYKTKWGTLKVIFVNNVANEMHLGYKIPDEFKICE
jgi:hypothetical protein